MALQHRQQLHCTAPQVEQLALLCGPTDTIHSLHLDSAFAHLPLLHLFLHALLKLCKGLGACSTRTSLGGGGGGTDRQSKGGGGVSTRRSLAGYGDMPQGICQGGQVDRQTAKQASRKELTVRQTGEGVSGGKGRLTTDIAFRPTYVS